MEKQEKGTQANPDGSLTPEEKVAQEKQENERLEAKAQEEGKTVDEIKEQESLEKEEQELQQRADEEGKTVEEIKADDEELAGIVKKYDGDPKKIAKAYKSSQQQFSKLSGEHTLTKDELAQVKSSLDKEPGKKLTSEEIEEGFQKRIEEVGYARAHGELTYKVANQIADEKIRGLKGFIANQQIDSVINSLESNLKGIKEYAPEIRKRLETTDFEIKTNPEAIKAVYYQLVGEKASKGDYKKEVEKAAKEKAEKDKKIIGQTNLGESKGVEKAISSGLTKEQEEERIRAGLSKEKYLDVLKYHQERDKKANRTLRTTIYNK